MEPGATEKIAEELTWQWGVRSDLGVARLVGLEGATPDGVYGLGASTMLDRLFCWLGELGVLDELRGLEGHGIQRASMPFERWVLLYFVRCLARIESQESLPELLFTDFALMSRLGFNAHDLRYGLTERGRTTRQGPRRNLPLDPEAMSKNLMKLEVSEVRAAFQSILKRLWAAVPTLPKRLLAAIDGTFLELGPKAKGAGVSKRTKQVRTKAGLQSVEVAIFGFKMVWLYVPELGLPLAVAFGTAELDERAFVRGLLADAREVLGGRAALDTIVLDRGFLDGPGLWELSSAGLRFVIPARRDLHVHAEALAATRGETPGIETFAKSRTTTHKKRVEGQKKLVSVQHTLDVVGVEGLRTMETYAPEEQVGGSGHRDRHKKSFEANRIHAVVLTREDGRDDPDFVLLTNGPVRQPFATFDDYDERSRIENQGHRELKQRWALECPVQRSAKAAEIHVYFVVLSFALTQTFRQWHDDQISLDEETGDSTVGRYHRRLAIENADKIIVFLGQEYGIFYTSEYSLLLGRPVKRPNPRAARTLDELLARLEAPRG